MSQKTEIILINISGGDKPGVTSALTRILARYNATILDIGQADIHHTLSLGILFKTTDDNSGEIMKDLLFKAYELEINIKDARKEVESLIGFGNEYYDSEIVFTKRAKGVLEKAWELAKAENKSRIGSEHMLLALTSEPSCLAMKTLEQLGVDAVEIREGIKILQNKDN